MSDKSKSSREQAKRDDQLKAAIVEYLVTCVNYGYFGIPDELLESAKTEAIRRLNALGYGVVFNQYTRTYSVRKS